MSASDKPKVLVLYYSMYNHIKQMAEEVKKGAEEGGAIVDVKRVPETLPKEVLEKMGAQQDDTPVAAVTDLPEYDAILFGIPTRFGMAVAQMKAFMDSTGSLWGSGALVGKLAGVFFSTATQGGGQETTALTFVTQITHHGMLFVPIGYSSPLLFNMDEVHGGSPYGAGTLANGDGSRQPSQLEKDVAKHQGKQMATYAAKMKKGSA